MNVPTKTIARNRLATSFLSSPGYLQRSRMPYAIAYQKNERIGLLLFFIP